MYRHRQISEVFQRCASFMEDWFLNPLFLLFQIFGGYNGTSLVENDTWQANGTEEDTLTTLSIVLVGKDFPQI